MFKRWLYENYNAETIACIMWAYLTAYIKNDYSILISVCDELNINASHFVYFMNEKEF